MAGLITLKCPSCGAKLHFEKDTQILTCDHCGNSHLLETGSQALPASSKQPVLDWIRRAFPASPKPPERERIHKNPPATFKYPVLDWMCVGEYQIFLHEVAEDQDGDQRAIYIDIEYANLSSKSPLGCRRNQWVLFDQENYSYEVEWSGNTLYKAQYSPYFGSERLLSLNMHARGWLAFKVPPTAKLKRLQFFTNFLFTHSVDILLDGR